MRTSMTRTTGVAKVLTLKNCRAHELELIMKRGLHPTRERRALIFAAGTLNNKRLQRELGSQELSTFYDGMLAAGHIDVNPYWPDYRRN
jgi:hypothetical protein